MILRINTIVSVIILLFFNFEVKLLSQSSHISILIETDSLMQIQDSLGITIKVKNNSKDTVILTSGDDYLEICELIDDIPTKCEILDSKTFEHKVVNPKSEIEFNYDITSDYYSVDVEGILTLVCNYSKHNSNEDQFVQPILARSNKSYVRIENNIDSTEFKDFVDCGFLRLTNQCDAELLLNAYNQFSYKYPESELKVKVNSYRDYYRLEMADLDSQISCLERDIKFNEVSKKFFIKKKLKLAYLYHRNENTDELKRILEEVIHEINK